MDFPRVPGVQLPSWDESITCGQMAEQRPRRRLAAIFAADVVGYTRLMDQDEAGTLTRLKTLRADKLDPLVEKYGGRIFKNTGDGVLVEFASATDAVQSAFEIQTALTEIQTALTESQHDIDHERRIVLRIGVSLGDVIVEGDDLFGNGVNVAARMETLAKPGGICISGNVHEHVASSMGLAFEDLGAQSVKNLERPVQAYNVVLDAPLATPADLPGRPSASPTTAPALPDKPSIAVLPFQNM
jgi:adenylate cyclase